MRGIMGGAPSVFGAVSHKPSLQYKIAGVLFLRGSGFDQENKKQ